MKDPNRPKFLSQEEEIEWIPGLEGRYAATTSGDIVSYKYDDEGRRLNQSNGRYPKVTIHNDGQSTHSVHRLVYRAFRGDCPEGRHICHNDGNPHNNRLDNLRADTPKGNARDKDEHGTTAKGESAGSSKLTAAEVREMRERYNSGCSALRLSEEYGVGKAATHRALRGDTWSHVGGPVSSGGFLCEKDVVEIRNRCSNGERPSEVSSDYGVTAKHIRDIASGKERKRVGGPITTFGKARGSRSGNSKLQEEDVRRIREEYDRTPATQAELAKEYGVSRGTISSIVRRKTWRHVS